MGERGWEYQLLAIRLELNTMIFGRVSHLHIPMLLFPSPEPVCSLQRINHPPSSWVGEGQRPDCTGSKLYFMKLLESSSFQLQSSNTLGFQSVVLPVSELFLGFVAASV